MGTPATPETLTPSLAVAINSEEHEYMEDPHSDFDLDNSNPDETREFVKKVLARIQVTLQIGVGFSWLTTEGGGSGIKKVDSSWHCVWEEPNDEEKWARTISDMLLCLPYGGPGQTYFQSASRDADLFGALERNQDKGYPIVAACQHLCTLAGISRGWKFNRGYIDADLGSRLKSIIEGLTPKPGVWFEDKASRIFVNEGKMNPWYTTEDHKVVPGSIYSFYNGLDANNNRAPGAHVAFVLRVNGDNTRVQFFDTVLGMQAPEPEKPAAKIGAGQKWVKAYDFGWTNQIRGPYHQKADGSSYQGLGIVPAPDDLAAKVNALQKARPLGLSRLVLTRRKTGTILYASPLLLMYDPKELFQNFTISRYLWSLRLLPGRKSMDAIWQIYIPRYALAEQMIYTYDELPEIQAKKPPNKRYQVSKDPDFDPEKFRKPAREKSLREMLRAVHGAEPPEILTEETDIRCVEYLSTSMDFAPAKSSPGRKDPDTFKKLNSYSKGIVRVVGYFHAKSTESTIKPTDAKRRLPWDKPSGEVRLTKKELESSGASYFVGSWDGNRYGPT